MVGDPAIRLLRTAAMAALYATVCCAREHIVGDSIWSIPPSNDFYINWPTNRSFTVGDFLMFRFETGFYDVVQVSRMEYEGCATENPFRSFPVGPATVPLDNEGMNYFVCSYGNYCGIGMKLAVSVQRSPPQ